MKFRSVLGFAVLFAAVLAIGLSMQPGQAHAAAPVLSESEQSSLQAVLDVTGTALDAIQLQIDRGTVQNPTAMLSTLSGIESYLLNLRGFLRGEPLASAPVTPSAARAPQAPSQVAGASDASGAGTGQEPVGDAIALDEPEPTDPIIPPVTTEDGPGDQQAATVSSGAASRWVFWLILVVAVVLAVILAVPRRRTSTVMSSGSEEPRPPQAPQPPEPQKPDRSQGQ